MNSAMLTMLAAIVASAKEKEYFGSALDATGLVGARSFCDVVKDATTKMVDETIEGVMEFDCEESDKMAAISGLLFAMDTAARLHGFLELALGEFDKITDENRQLKEYVDELEMDMVKEIKDPYQQMDDEDMKALQEMREREHASRFGHNSSQRDDGA